MDATPRQHDCADCTKPVTDRNDVCIAKLIESRHRMPLIITASFVFGTVAILAALRALRPRFRFSWLLAIGGTTAAWLSIFFWLPVLPVTLAVPLWTAAGSTISFATFSVGGESWPLALSILTAALTFLLTAPARAKFPEPAAWAIGLAIAGMGLLAVSAGSPLTLVLFWAGLDLMDAGAALARAESRSTGSSVAIAFAARLGSIALALLALVLGDSSGGISLAGGERASGTALLPAAALLRLWAFAFPWLNQAPASTGDEIETMLQLTGGISAVALLSKIQFDAQRSSGLILAGCMISALYAGWMWFRAPNRRLARPLWFMGMGSLAIAATLRHSPMGAAGLTGGAMLAASALFFATKGERWVNRILLSGVWLACALPFSLSSMSWVGEAGIWDLVLPGLLIAQALLLAGFAHWAMRAETESSLPPEWSHLRGIYRAGVVLPLVIGSLLGFWGWTGAFQIGAPLAGVLAVAAAAALLWAKSHLASLSPVPMEWLPKPWQAAFSGSSRAAGQIQAALQRAVYGFTRVMEGGAGLMWSLLLLVLFVSLIARGQH